MKKSIKILLTFLSLAVTIGAILLVWRITNPNSISLKKINQAQLTAADGKFGRSCYIALEGQVYEIKNSLYWEQGQHKPSGGQANCGKDLTDVISRSPHGKTILSRMTHIGQLVQ